eukprot:TRINITY_DN11063_c0_g1_i1.p2 TRINITY_DN11063_c0_g1~~TRINITY_DN11063_c0_g1_i1.p2  ORF type:complete len:169 (-),score=22.32 TRINITY_DN11063_c0_g1_i1:23-529(-)
MPSPLRIHSVPVKRNYIRTFYQNLAEKFLTQFEQLSHLNSPPINSKKNSLDQFMSTQSLNKTIERSNFRLKPLKKKKKKLQQSLCAEPEPFGLQALEKYKLQQLTKHRAESLMKEGEDLYLPSFLLNCLLYTSDAADDTPCVDLGGRRIIKKKKTPYLKTFIQHNQQI